MYCHQNIIGGKYNRRYRDRLYIKMMRYPQKKMIETITTWVFYLFQLNNKNDIAARKETDTGQAR